MSSIKFGTDGWRAIIAYDYNFENLNVVTQATARWIKEKNITNNGVVIGYDGRFMGKEFSQYVASVFAAKDIPVRLANRMAPTPAISWAAQHYDAVGIVITASHNPPKYNGFKIKAPFGGPAPPHQISEVEDRLDQFDGSLEVDDYGDYLNSNSVEELDITGEYLDVIRERLDLDAIRKSNSKIAHDPMYGSAQGLVKDLLGDDVEVIEVRTDVNPGFHGISPEPIEKNLQELTRTIVDNNCTIGIANDGDGDRIGMFDENGKFVDSHQMLSLLAKFLKEVRGESGMIVKTFSATNMLDKIAENYGFPIEVLPIGFKHVAEKFVSEDVLVGGEESGGLGVKGHIPERDGIFIGLLITEMTVKSGKNLSELVQELYDEYGMHATYRNDMHTSDKKKHAMMKYCKEKKMTELAGKKVSEWAFIDGVKHIFEDGSWLLVRPSGTEPLLRIYSEASSEMDAVKLVDEASKLVDSPKIME